MATCTSRCSRRVATSTGGSTPRRRSPSWPRSGGTREGSVELRLSLPVRAPPRRPPVHGSRILTRGLRRSAQTRNGQDSLRGRDKTGAHPRSRPEQRSPTDVASLSHAPCPRDSYPQSLKLSPAAADRTWVNTIAATTSRAPRPVVIAVVALVAAFAALMVVRVGVLGGSSDSTLATPVAPSTPTTTPAKTFTKPAAAKPNVLSSCPDFRRAWLDALRYSKVAVVSLYVGQAAGDRAVVGQVRKGARSTGAGFVAINVGSDKRRNPSPRSPAPCRHRRCWSSAAPARSWPGSPVRSTAP